MTPDEEKFLKESLNPIDCATIDEVVENVLIGAILHRLFIVTSLVLDSRDCHRPGFVDDFNGKVNLLVGRIMPACGYQFVTTEIPLGDG